ncbi:hypothetical protein CEV33_3214 [Brucella grignonensis]|uniref:Uncharacterized protein n=1 Tax=Brucella grignonensis TaxID=94627 RepID=A0A256F0P8_9HYPH|nr:hypothetical protein CEV33_3214 [Brucella grignonensis]
MPWNAVVSPQDLFGLVPEILDAIYMVLLVGKQLRMVDPTVIKFGNIRHA